jgi:hypothetical protein
MDTQLTQAKTFFETFLKSGTSSYGILVLEVVSFMDYRDCYGVVMADETSDRIASLLKDIIGSFNGAVFRLSYIHLQFLVICPESSNANEFATLAQVKLSELQIRTVDDSHLKKYPIAPKGCLTLTVSVLLLDRRVIYSHCDSLLNKAISLHEICGMHRKGLNTILDLTLNNEIA